MDYVVLQVLVSHFYGNRAGLHGQRRNARSRRLCEEVGSSDRSTHGGGGTSTDAGSRGHIISAMSLKSAALFALVGMILLTVLLALDFIRDMSAFTAGAISANAMLVSLVHLLASLSVTVFLFVFHKTQS
jgi:hypothetical protein